MKICLPVVKKNGFESEVNAHFGSAPYFAIYDSEGNTLVFVKNGDSEHEHGMCQPTKLLKNQKINAVVCGGMGARAIQILNDMGIDAYQIDNITVKEAVSSLNKKSLRKMSPENACAHHNCR